jgi:hypothetical protein
VIMSVAALAIVILLWKVNTPEFKDMFASR